MFFTAKNSNTCSTSGQAVTNTQDQILKIINEENNRIDREKVEELTLFNNFCELKTYLLQNNWFYDEIHDRLIERAFHKDYNINIFEHRTLSMSQSYMEYYSGCLYSLYYGNRFIDTIDLKIENGIDKINELIALLKIN